jgi:hypothetical protein
MNDDINVTLKDICQTIQIAEVARLTKEVPLSSLQFSNENSRKCVETRTYTVEGRTYHQPPNNPTTVSIEVQSVHKLMTEVQGSFHREKAKQNNLHTFNTVGLDKLTAVADQILWDALHRLTLQRTRQGALGSGVIRKS